MGILISSSDFVGTYAIATDVYTETDLDLMITEKEEDLLVDLLGQDLYDLFYADLVNGVPQEDIYLKIYNKLRFESNLYCAPNGVIVKSKGMKVMLLSWIFFYFVRKQPVDNAIGGNLSSKSTISDGVNQFMPLINYYNDAVDTYRAIQQYIIQNKTTYPTFQGVEKQLTTVF